MTDFEANILQREIKGGHYSPSEHTKRAAGCPKYRSWRNRQDLGRSPPSLGKLEREEFLNRQPCNRCCRHSPERVASLGQPNKLTQSFSLRNWRGRRSSGTRGFWARRVKGPGHCTPQLSLLQRKALGAYAACHLLGAQCESKNVLVVALLILQGGKELNGSDPELWLPA